MTFCNIVFTNNKQEVKIFLLAMCLISNLDKFWWYLVFWAALQIASYIPFMHAWKRKIFAPNVINDIFLMIFSYQSLWCWWQHMNSQRSLGCSWLRFSIGFRPGQIGFLNVSFLKTYWSFDQLNLTKLPM